MLVDEHVQHATGVELIPHEQAPATELGRHGRSLEVSLPRVEGTEVLLDRLQDLRSLRGIAITTEIVPVDVMEQGSGVVPRQTALEFTDLAVVAVRSGTVCRLQTSFDLVQRGDVPLVMRIVMPVGRFERHDIGEQGLCFVIRVGTRSEFPLVGHCMDLQN